jgi:two-component system LytT family response regulator
VVRAGEIAWIEAAGDYAGLHVGPHLHLAAETMNGLAGELDPRQFVRIHRSAIVRIDAVRELHPHRNGEYFVVLEDGTRIKSSRGYREDLQAALGARL